MIKQPTRHKRIDAHFRPEDEELYQFVKSQVNGWGDTSQAIRRFVEIAQLFDGNITEAQLARQALAYLQCNYPNWEELIKGEQWNNQL